MMIFGLYGLYTLGVDSMVHPLIFIHLEMGIDIVMIMRLIELIMSFSHD